MQQYIVGRILSTLLVLLLVVVMAFLALNLLPGDDVVDVRLAGLALTPEEIQEFRAEHGISDPLAERFVEWLGDFVTGDFGVSLFNDVPIVDEIGRRIGNSFELGAFALIGSILFALPLGIFSAIRPNTIFDHSARFVTILGLAIPNFVVGVFMILFFSKVFQYTPPVGFVTLTDDPLKNLEQLWMPVLMLSFAGAAAISRFTRTQMLEVLHQDYIRTANAKGLRERQVVWSHAARNALIPVVTIMGLQAGIIIAGSVVAEILFNIPGMGFYLVDSIRNRDTTAVQALIVIFGATILLANLLVDLSYAVLDPRIRY